MAEKGNMYEGLTDRSPKAPTETPQGASVNSESTRTTAAPTPKPLGPRAA
jgi:hypothetical protein